jgi:hypothetical protein
MGRSRARSAELRHSPPHSCIPSRARAINRVQSRSIVSIDTHRSCSRVSTQNSDKSLYQLFACSCDSISHDLPFVSVVK